MKIVQGQAVEWVRGLEYRGGVFHYRRLMEGEPGRIDNFQLNIGRQGGAFYSPRHRHNFEQIRFQLAGELDFARDGKLKTGMVGYFPEGMAYGPQTQDPDTTPMTVVLQMGGASGSGYLSGKEVKAGMEALKAEGEFSDGVFRRRKDVAGKRNVDGYQAIWEYVNKQAMIYPKPRYSRPFMADPSSYEWVPLADATGVAERFVGVFTERRSSVRFLRLDPGASWTAEGRSIHFVVKGTGTAGNESLSALTTVYLNYDESLALAANDQVEMIEFGLPDLRTLEASRRRITAVAAE